MSRALVLVALVACSSTSPRTEGPTGGGSGSSMTAGSDSATATGSDSSLTTDFGSSVAAGSSSSVNAGSGSAVVIAPPKGCPATFQAARGAACSASSPCTYAEGACKCAGPQWCGGMAPPADFYQQAPSWQCRMGGGCPVDQPPDGSACKPAGKKCDYTCSCMQVSECTKGVWKTRRGACKP